jgi:hypothetical protein
VIADRCGLPALAHRHLGKSGQRGAARQLRAATDAPPEWSTRWSSDRYLAATIARWCVTRTRTFCHTTTPPRQSTPRSAG